jgi:hypothetical protein
VAPSPNSHHSDLNKIFPGVGLKSLRKKKAPHLQ